MHGLVAAQSAIQVLAVQLVCWFTQQSRCCDLTPRYIIPFHWRSKELSASPDGDLRQPAIQCMDPWVMAWIKGHSDLTHQCLFEANPYDLMILTPNVRAANGAAGGFPRHRFDVWQPSGSCCQVHSSQCSNNPSRYQVLVDW